MADRNSHIDDVLLAKYLAGECSNEEKILVENWMNGDEKSSKVYQQSRKLFEAHYDIPSEKEPQFDVEKAWKKVYGKLDLPSANQQDVSPSEKKPNTKLFLSYAWKIAATIVIAAGVTFYFFERGNKNTYRYSVSLNKIREFYLPDSTKVILKDNSQLDVDKNYGEENRSVQLTGLAYFDVQRDPSKKFIVNTDGARVEVLGTQFLVDGKTPNLVKVMVESGTVKLSSNQKPDEVSVILQKNQSAELNTHDQSITEMETDNINNLYWANKKLTYRQRPLDEVFDELGTLFQKTIVYDSAAIKNCKLTAIFRNESFDSIMKNVSVSLNFDYKIQQQQYIITSNGCNEE